jgi:hypothetical protein
MCDPAVYAFWGGDRAECVKTYKVACVDDLSANGSKRTADQVESCAVARSRLTCDDILISATRPPECTVTGTLPAGAPCGADAQCMSAQCAITLGEACGTCHPSAPAGTPCSVRSDCDRGMNCIAGMCAARIPLGGHCDTSNRCMGVLHCSGLTSGAGTCARPLGQGARCDIDADYDPCDYVADLSCDTTSHTCQPRAVAKTGEPCGAIDADAGIDGPYVDCEASAYCRIDTGTSGTCVVRPKLGASCEAPYGCIPPAQCLDSMCAVPSSNDCK